MWLENKTWTRPIEWTRGAQSEIFCFDSFLPFAARALSPADGWRVGCVAVPPRTSYTNWGESWSPESLETDNIRRHTVHTVVPPIPCGPARAERLARDQIALERTLTLINGSSIMYSDRMHECVGFLDRSLYCTLPYYTVCSLPQPVELDEPTLRHFCRPKALRAVYLFLTYNSGLVNFKFHKYFCIFAFLTSVVPMSHSMFLRNWRR